MRRSIAVALFTVCLAGQISTGQEQSDCSLVATKNWVRFDLVLGRITATQIGGGKRNCSQKTGATETRRELLSVTGNSTVPSIRYERADRTQLLTVEILKRNDVFILREPQPGAKTVRLEFAQPQRGTIKLVVGERDHPIASISTDSMWHLLLAEPELCRQELMPVLNLLCPHWKLMETASQVEVDLFRAAVDGDGASIAYVRQLVETLDSPQFFERQQADQQLRGLGVAVLTQFKQIDRATLTREQRQRIERIEKDMAVLAADTPERIVAWMLNDESVWLSMLSCQDASKRQLAVGRLSRTFPTATKFNPHAEEFQRRKQIEALRLRISSRR